MRKNGLWLITMCLFVTSWTWSQEAEQPQGKVLTEVYVKNLRALINSDVVIKGIAGAVKADPSNTAVYALSDMYGDTIRVRSAEGNPPLHQTYLVRGMVKELEGQLELVELGRRSPATPIGVPPLETWVVGAAEPPDDRETDGDTDADGEGSEGSEDGILYMLLGGGGILVVAAVAIAMSMKRGTERRQRQEQMQLEKQRLAQMQWPVVQPGNTIVEAPVIEAASSPAMTMVSWGTLTVVDGPLEGKVYPLPHGAIRIGRTEGDIVLETDESVSCKHATLSQTGNGAVYLEDHSRNGTSLNDRRINNESAQVHSGDRIVIGPHTLEIKCSGAACPPSRAQSSAAGPALTIEMPAQQAATIAFTGVQLVVEEGPDTGKACPVNLPQTTIGRETGDLLLTDPHVSRRHATIFSQNGGWVLQNESNHGTMVNNLRVEQQVLHDGDRIRMGGTVVRFDSLNEASEPQSSDQ